jgi:protein-glutamine gamma-glutamyltransferase
MIQLVAFAVLALYGALRWGTLLAPEQTGRLLGLVALAVVIAALGAVPVVHRGSVAILLGVVGLLAVLCIAGIPVSWIRHVRIAVTSREIGDGLSALPNALVPYIGINDAVREVNLMGAGVLLLDAALILALAPRSLGEIRLAVAALPLVVLAIVPSALGRPPLPYLHGVILFVLLAAFVWGERVRTTGSVTAVGIVIVGAAAAMIAAPVLDTHKPWFDVGKLAATLGPGRGESFDWSQSYGPLHWPRTGHEVLAVKATTPDYWKAQDLDIFDGRGWSAASGAVGNPYQGIDARSLGNAKWTQTIQVTISDMTTTSVIAAGTAVKPTHIAGTLLPGASSGTWLAATTLEPGDSYKVRVYTPHPSQAELATAGTDYRAAPLTNYLTLTLPPFSVVDHGAVVPIEPQPVSFAPFGRPQSASVDAITNRPAAALLAVSPYARTYALARRLQARSATPYDYVTAVMRYLGHGFRYDENPAPAALPLISFLFKTHAGYCQQFAGAMALLLRMGGVPARVSAGFTTGSYDKTRKEYLVSDIDAHAWVEAWFPHYGWVRFDPTPGAAPARGGHVPLPSLSHTAVGKLRTSPIQRKPDPALPKPTGTVSVGRPTGTPTPLIAFGAVIAALLTGLLATVSRVSRSRRADPLDELERAFARCGRPLAPGSTLVTLEHRLRFSADAAAYVRQLRVARFAGLPASTTAAQRRAVREQLAAGAGPVGRLRALWALPPQPRADWPFRGHRPAS